MANLAEGMQQEIKRCQELVLEYDRLGPVGKMMIQQTINEAITAPMSGNVIQMLQSYEALKGCE